jgi:hypothetical protein
MIAVITAMESFKSQVLMAARSAANDSLIISNNFNLETSKKEPHLIIVDTRLPMDAKQIQKGVAELTSRFKQAHILAIYPEHQSNLHSGKMHHPVSMNQLIKLFKKSA